MLDNEDDARNTVSASHLHNAYIQYSFMKSNIKVGRQTIKLPLIMNSGAFAVEDYFESAVVTLNEIPNTMVKLIYIQEWHKRYGSDASGSPTQEDIHYSDGLYSLYFSNKSIKNLKIDGQYLTTNEEASNFDAPVAVAGGYDEYFLRTNYKFSTDYPISLGLTYGGAEFDANGVDSTSFYGITLGTKVANTLLKVAYSSTDDDNSFPATLGHVPDPALIPTAMLSTNSMFAGTEAISLQAIPNLGIKGLFTRFKVAHFSQSENGIANAPSVPVAYGNVDGATEIDADMKYSFTGALKGLSTRLWAGYTMYDDSSAEDEDFLYARWYLNYKF